MSDEGTAARAPASPPEKKRAPRAKAAEKTKLDEPVPQLVDDGGPEVEVTTTEFGAFFPVEVVDVLVRLPNPNPVLVLQTADPPARTLEIPIGSAEGISIANALRDVPTPKPLTHALFAETLT
ncbi:MAG: bifunctional nuclease domain-containing protein, partial [Acidimicrobiales bacterium]